MSEKYSDYNNISDWKSSAADYFQSKIESFFISEAAEEIANWAMESEYNFSIAADNFELTEEEYDNTDVDIIEDLLREVPAEDLMAFARENEIDIQIPYLVALDNGEFSEITISSLESEDDLVMEEVRIALEYREFEKNNQGHEAVIISPMGTEKEGVISENGFEESREEINYDR